MSMFDMIPPALIPCSIVDTIAATHLNLTNNRTQVKSACTSCRKACKKCEQQRPCQRCVRMGNADDCVDWVRKSREKGYKRGPYRKKSIGEDGFTQPTTDELAAAKKKKPARSLASVSTPETNLALDLEYYAHSNVLEEWGQRDINPYHEIACSSVEVKPKPQRGSVMDDVKFMDALQREIYDYDQAHEHGLTSMDNLEGDALIDFSPCQYPHLKHWWNE